MRILLLTLALLYSLAAEATSASTREAECENLLNAVLPFAEQMLKKEGEFYPFGAVLKVEGEIAYLAGYDGREQPPSQDIIHLLKTALVQGASSGQYEATVLVYGVKAKLPDSGQMSDAIAMSINHRAGYSVIIVLPYQLRNGQIVYGEVFTQKGERDVFLHLNSP